MKSFPVFVIGLMLTLIGAEVLFAPDAIVVTPAHKIAFDYIGRGPLGIALAVSGIMTVFEGLKGSAAYLGMFMGIANSFFWFVVTLLPLFYGAQPVEIFGVQVQGSINGVSVLAWATLTVLLTYFYLQFRDPRRDEEEWVALREELKNS